MNTRKTMPEDDKQKMSSSPGNTSRSVTPKDIGSGAAAASDVRARQLTSSDEEERQQEQLDDAVEMTFPASDPIAIHDPDQDRPRERRH